MTDKKNNNHGGARPNSGSKRKTLNASFMKNVDKYSQVFWDNLGAMMEGNDKGDRRFAMQEYNKIQVKMIPQDITSDGKALPKPIMQINEIQRNIGNSQNKEPNQED